MHCMVYGVSWCLHGVWCELAVVVVMVVVVAAAAATAAAVVGGVVVHLPHECAALRIHSSC